MIDEETKNWRSGRGNANCTGEGCGTFYGGNATGVGYGAGEAAGALAEHMDWAQATGSGEDNNTGRCSAIDILDISACDSHDMPGNVFYVPKDLYQYVRMANARR